MFDSALLESRADRRRGPRRAGLPVAAAVHAAAIAAVVGASLANVEEPPEPIVPVRFIAAGAPSPPPPPIGGEGHVRTRPMPRVQLPVRGMPDLSSGPPDDRAEDRGEASESPDGDRPGLPTGAGDGTGIGPATDASGGGNDEGPLPIGGDVKPPQLTRRIEPAYPESARRAGLSGAVILEAVITASGEVEDVRVVRSVDPLLDDSALTAVRQWRYRPATLGGRAVRVILTVTVTYRLDR